MDPQLEKSILKTICYFDMFNYPLTLLELWRWIFDKHDSNYSLGDIKNCLIDSDWLSNRIECQNGFYFLSGRVGLVSFRMKRHNFAIAKFKKTLKLTSIIKFLPYIKMIAVSNTLAYSNSEIQGDIDLFLVAEHGKLWKVRFLVVSLLKLFNLRPTIQDSQDKFCTPFFISEKHLSLAVVKSANRDEHFACWLSQIWPVFDRGVYSRFIANNAWIKSVVPHASEIKTVSQKKVSNNSFFVSEALAALLDFFPERLFYFIQMKIMPSELKNVINKSTDVVTNDHLLKFHLQDKRSYYNKKLSQLLTQLS